MKHKNIYTNTHTYTLEVSYSYTHMYKQRKKILNHTQIHTSIENKALNEICVFDDTATQQQIAAIQRYLFITFYPVNKSGMTICTKYSTYFVSLSVTTEI